MAPVKKTAAKAQVAKKAQTKKITKKASTNASAKRRVTKVTEEQIRTRAYEIYEDSGSQHGGHFQHWVQAEKELTSN